MISNWARSEFALFPLEEPLKFPPQPTKTTAFGYNQRRKIPRLWGSCFGASFYFDLSTGNSSLTCQKRTGLNLIITHIIKVFSLLLLYYIPSLQTSPGYWSTRAVAFLTSLTTQTFSFYFFFSGYAPGRRPICHCLCDGARHTQRTTNLGRLVG